MAITITTDCINCNACPPECPNNAIYEEGEQWTWAQGTSLTEVELEDGTKVDVNELQAPLSNDYVYIVP